MVRRKTENRKIKITSDAPLRESGLSHIIMMEKSLRQKWVESPDKGNKLLLTSRKATEDRGMKYLTSKCIWLQRSIYF